MPDNPQRGRVPRMTDPLEPAYDVFTLEALKLAAKEVISDHLIESMSVATYRDQTLRGLVLELRALIYTKKLGAREVRGNAQAEFHQPANWREAWKLAHTTTWYGRLVIRWWPVKPLETVRKLARCTVIVDQYAAFPELPFRPPPSLGGVVNLPIMRPMVWDWTDPASGGDQG